MVRNAREVGIAGMSTTDVTSTSLTRSSCFPTPPYVSRALFTSPNALGIRWSRCGRVLAGGRRQTRRFVSVDSSLLPASDVRVGRDKRVEAVLTPVTPREGVNPSSQQHSSLNNCCPSSLRWGRAKKIKAQQGKCEKKKGTAG